MHGHSSPLGIVALGFSFLTLLLSILPPYLLERKITALEQLCDTTHSSYTFTCDNSQPGHAYKLNIDNCADELHSLRQGLRCCKLCLPLVALAALGMALCSWRKEKTNYLCLFTIAAASTALAWPYIGAPAAVSIALVGFTLLTAWL